MFGPSITSTKKTQKKAAKKKNEESARGKIRQNELFRERKVKTLLTRNITIENNCVVVTKPWRNLSPRCYLGDSSQVINLQRLPLLAAQLTIAPC